MKAVNAYFSGKQLLPCDITEQNTGNRTVQDGYDMLLCIKVTSVNTLR